MAHSSSTSMVLYEYTITEVWNQVLLRFVESQVNTERRLLYFVQ